MKKTKIAALVATLCLTLALPQLGFASAQTDLSEKAQRFEFSNALTGMDYIQQYLGSFKKLTKLTASQLSAEDQQQIGNLGWEMQNLGFQNWTQTVEGTLRKQKYDIQRLEYELAQERFQSGKITKTALYEKEQQFQLARQDWEQFIRNVRIAD
nr:hypothetical protein [uncultured Anaeromusa sp.]